jgi:Domain of unknown function (DUF4439)
MSGRTGGRPGPEETGRHVRAAAAPRPAWDPGLPPAAAVVPVRAGAAPTSKPDPSASARPATLAALQAALAAEHAAIYGYGVLGAVLTGVRQERARRAWEIHRTRRDRLHAVISERGTTPVAARPAYQLPFPVDSGRAAARLAATLEDGVTAAYLAVVGVAGPHLRRYAARAMQEAVVRAIQWRGSAPTAFPGLS